MHHPAGGGARGVVVLGLGCRGVMVGPMVGLLIPVGTEDTDLDRRSAGLVGQGRVPDPA